MLWASLIGLKMGFPILLNYRQAREWRSFSGQNLTCVYIHIIFHFFEGKMISSKVSAKPPAMPGV